MSDQHDDVSLNDANREASLAARPVLPEEAYGTPGIGLWKVHLDSGRLFWCHETAALLALGDAREGSLEDFLEHVQAEDRERVREVLTRARDEHGPIEVELCTEPRAGAHRHLLLRGKVHRDARAHIHKAAGTLVDISRVKHAEEELRKTLEARDEFLSIASHELNTPLTVLQLNLQNLQRKLNRSDQGSVELEVIQKHVAPMVRQVGRLSRLLSDLLDVSRIQTQRLHLNLEAFDLCDTLHETVTRFLPLAAEQETELTVAHCEPLIGYWDRLRVEQVLSNLIANGIKYGQQNPVTLSLERRGELAAMTVRDQGIGISSEDLARIFRRFERATGIRRSESFGLGLYISEQIARAHGGQIEVESALGEGSSFTLLLPIHRTSQDDQEQV